MKLKITIKIYTKSDTKSFTEETTIKKNKPEKEEQIIKKIENFYQNLYPEAEIIRYFIERA